MIRMYILVVGIFVAGSAYATLPPDLPKNDPFIASLRKEFRNATAPSLSELRSGKTWYCRGASAWRGSHLKFEGDGLRFIRLTDSLVINELGFGGSTENVALLPEGWVGSYVPGDCGEVGRYDIRVTKGGDLILESGSKFTDNCPLTSDRVRSQVDESYSAEWYLICPADRLHE